MQTRAKIDRYFIRRLSSAAIYILLFQISQIPFFAQSIALSAEPRAAASAALPASSAPAAPADSRNIEMSLEERVKALESYADQVMRESELTLQLYKMAMNMAIEEAKSEFQALRTNQFVQQCSIGINRASSCLEVWRISTRILETAFARRNVAGPQNEFQKRFIRLVEDAKRSGAFAPIRTVEWEDEGVLSYVIERHRAKRCIDLQQTMARILSSLGNALTSNSSISVSTKAILEPVRLMAERPAAEKVDVVWILLNSLENAQNELNKVKIEPSKDLKLSWDKLLMLRNLWQPR